MVAMTEEGISWQIVALVTKAGWSQKRAAEEFGLAKSTVSNILKKERELGDVKKKAGQGRPRKTDDADDEFLFEYLRDNEFKSLYDAADELQRQHHRTISCDTVRRRVMKRGLRAYRPAKFPVLTNAAKVKRLQFGRDHRHWNRNYWSNVVFSDESRFKVRFCDGRIRVWRFRNTRYDPKNMVQFDRFGGGSVMIWGAISYNHKSALHVVPDTLKAQQYLNDVLIPIAIPFGEQSVGDGFIFQDDNARPHRARIINDYHNHNDSYVHMALPPYSPGEYFLFFIFVG